MTYNFVILTWAAGQSRSGVARRARLAVSRSILMLSVCCIAISISFVMLERGAQLPEVQRVLGHSRLSTTGIYLTPCEEDLRSALGRAGL